MNDLGQEKPALSCYNKGFHTSVTGKNDIWLFLFLGTFLGLRCHSSSRLRLQADLESGDVVRS